MKKILIVEDVLSEASLLEEILKEEDYETIIAKDAEEAEKIYSQEILNLLLLDLKLPGKSGLEFLSSLRKRGEDTPAIMMSAYGEIEDAVNLIRLGAYDFIEKPLDANRVIITIRNCIRDYEQKKELQFLREQDDRLIGKSSVVENLYKTIEIVAKKDIRVFITGPTGVGKNLVARLIHKKSQRRKKPFIHINCAAIPEALIESELFGYQKGAFTGANKDKKGLVESALSGTLFLDEIAEIPPQVQIKILDFLETGEFQTVGGIKKQKIDTRIIAATNRDVNKAIQKGELREDIYYRLNVVRIDIPPLKEWKEDVPILFRYFLKGFSFDKESPAIKSDVDELLMAYHWPGNVREVRNLAERISVFSSESEIDVSILNLFWKKDEEDVPEIQDDITFAKAREEFDRKFIEKAIQKAGGSITEAAKNLGVNRSSLYKKLKKLGIE